jgi:hypothetical protein
LPRKSHKLAALRLLSYGLSKLEKRHQERIERGDNPAEVDRETAQSALNGVLAFFQDYDIEAKPLVRLLSALAALTAGANLPAMLTPVSMRHRRPDPPTVEMVKGRLAAVMEFRQETGLSRKAASEWVVRNLPSKVKRELGSISPATVNNWLARWGGQRGTAGDGRDGYLHMRTILRGRRIPERELKKLLQLLDKALPS